MAIQFPANPIVGIEAIIDGKTYVWNGAAWKLTTTAPGAVPVPSLTALSQNIIPNTDEQYDLGSSTKKFRDLYLSGNTLVLGDTSISASDGELSITSPSNPDPAPIGGGANIYATADDLPLSGVSAGAFAHVTATNTLYMNNGSGWYKIALINTAPSITSGGAGSYALATDGTPTVITLEATDPEGIPITWSYSVTSGSLGSTATVVQADNVFTVTPSTDSNNSGSFTITFTASDGVNIATDVNSFSLAFLSALWDETVLSIGTNSTNGLDNSTFIDRSTNAHTVTTSGSPVQTEFHPYLDYYSFDTVNGGQLRSDYSGALGTSDFSIETWMYLVSGTSYGWTGNRGSIASGGLGSRLTSTSISIGLSSGTSYNQVMNATGIPDLTSRWAHVVICRSSGTTSIFVDGVRYATSATSYNWSSTNAPWAIGMEYGDYNSNSTNDINFFDYRLVIGSSAYDATQTTLTVPTEKLTAITNTQILACRSNRFIDESGNNVTLTPLTSNTGPQISAFNPFSQGSEYAVGENKGSFYADGDDYLELSTADVDFVNEGSNFTIQGWVHSTSSQGDQVRWCGTGIGSADRGFVCWIDYAGENINLRICGGGGFTDNTFAFTENVVKGSWNHVAFCHDGSNLTAYWNGEKSSTSISTASVGFVSGAASQNLHVGRTAVSSLNFLNGYISDFKISTVAEYSSTFTPSTAPLGNTNARVYLPMDNAGIFDKTGNNTLTLGGNTATSTTQTKYANTSMYFDGTGDYVSVNNFPPIGSGDYTMEFWMNGSNVETGTWQSLLSRDYASADGFRLYKKAGTPELVFYNGTTATATTVSSGLTNNTWHHIAVVRNSGTLDIYVDGVSKVSVSNTSDISESVKPVNIGGNVGEASNYPFPGYLENVQLFIGTAKYTANFTPPTETQGRSYQAES